MKAIVIGASSGGPKALEDVLFSLPKDLNAYVVVIQHLPMQFTKSMSKRFNKESTLPVSQMYNGEILEPNHIYIVPGDYHFFLAKAYSKSEKKTELQCYLINAIGKLHPSIDMGFTSMAEHFGPETIGVILTGMGNDGLIGSKAIKQLDGYVIIQDKDSSAIYGMPQAVHIAGLADEELPLTKITSRLIELVKK